MTSHPRSLLYFLVLLFALISFSKFEADPDLYGHITIGERIIAEKSIPTTNDYSYTEPHHEWVNQYWLAELIFAIIFLWGGTPALLVFQWLMGGLILFLLMRLAFREVPGGSQLSIFIVMVISIGLVRFGLNLRPQIFTYLNTALLLILLAPNKVQRKQLLLLPPLFAFWINLHGAVIAGLGIYLVWVIVEILKHLRHSWWLQRELPKLLVLSLLILLATLINPYGYKLHEFLWFANTLDHQFLMEWQALTWAVNTNLFIKVVLPLWLGLILYQIRLKMYMNPFYILLSIITALLAIQHIRHIPFFGIAAPLVMAPPLNRLFLQRGQSLINVWDGFQHKWQNWKVHTRAMIISLLTITVLFALVPYGQFRLFINHTYPLAQVKFLQEQGWQGKLLNEYDWGYYLMRELGGLVKIAIDGRYETAYSVEKSQETLAFLSDPIKNQVYLDNSEADMAILRSTGVPARITGGHEDWVLVNYNSKAALLARRSFVEKQPSFDPTLPTLVTPRDFLFK